MVFATILFWALPTYAAPTAVKLSPQEGLADVDIYQYVSACDIMSGEKQTIIFNNKATAFSTAYFFQHGDGIWTTSRYVSLSASKINNIAKDYVFIGFTISAQSKGGPWSAEYNFPCYYNEVLGVMQSLGKSLPNNTILGSYSRGGAAITNTFRKSKIPANVSIVKTLFFDSCYGDQCEFIAGLGSSRRGAMLAYVSTSSTLPGDGPLGNENSQKNQAATKNLLSISQDNVYVATISGAHGDVPANCTWEFLLKKDCNKRMISSAGQAGDITGKGGTAPSSTGWVGGSGGTSSGGASGGLDFWGGMTLKEMSDEEILKMVTKPSIKIEIPGVNFSDPTIGEENGLKYAFFPFLSEYIGAVYQYAIAVASAIAVCMIIFYGFMITFSGGSSDKVGTAKTRITQAVVGLIIAVSSYVILYAINPELVKLKNLKVYIIDTVELNTWLPDSFQDGVNMTGMNLTGPGTVLGTPYQKPVIPNPSCGKNLAQIAKTAVEQGPICNRSCSCAWFVSTMLEISGCPNKTANGKDIPFFDEDADTMVAYLLKQGPEGNGWKDIGSAKPKAGDIVYFYTERSNITHVGIVYDPNTNPMRMIDSNVNISTCWGNKKEEVYAKCSYTSNGKTYKGDQARRQVYKDAQPGALGGQQIASYNACVASVGVCPPTLPYSGAMCNYCNKFQRRMAEEEAGGHCVERQCVQISNITGNNGGTRKFGFISNPNP